MDLFGKNIDKETVNKIAQMLNNPEGEKIKKEFSKLNKQQFLNALRSIDMSNINMNDFQNALNSISQQELLNKLNSIDVKKFGNNK